MKTNNSFKQDKGVAGLTILLSLIVMLFIIGLIVMIFALMGGSLQDATFTSSTGTGSNETVTTLNNTVGDSLSVAGYRGVVCTATIVTNATGGETVPSSNYTLANSCLLTGTADSVYINTNVNVSYTYTYNADNTATIVINDTAQGIANVTDWYPIFIVIGAMVVLILLVVIIITSIKGSGVMATTGGSTGTRGYA